MSSPISDAERDAQAKVAAWFSDDRNKQIIDRYGREMLTALRDQVPWEYVKLIASLMMKIDSLTKESKQ